LLQRNKGLDMTIHTAKSPIGLDGVAAAETRLSHVDGEKGELIIAGAWVSDLAAAHSFEGVTARLWSLAAARRVGRRTIDERRSAHRRARRPSRTPQR